MRTAFVFWDETKTAFVFFAEVIAMMGLFIAIGYYGSKLLTGGKCGRIKQKVLKCLAFLIPVLLCVAVILWIGFGKQNDPSDSWSVTVEDLSDTEEDGSVEGQVPDSDPTEADDGFALVPGGTFVMGSLEKGCRWTVYHGWMRSIIPGVHPCLRMSAHGWKQIMWIKNNRRIRL